MKLRPRKRAEFPLFLPHRPDADSYRVPQARPRDAAGTALPVPPPETWIAPDKYGRTVEEYLAGGRREVDQMIDLVGQCGIDVRTLGNVFELGCADGRMLRWFEPLAVDREVWGSDLDATRILWCRQHLSPPLRFLTNTIVPHLPFEDRKFGFVYAGSVFSHIDDLADSWFAELHRILRPGGIFFVTVHLKEDVQLITSRYSKFGLARKLLRHPEYDAVSRGEYDVFTIGRSRSSFVFYDLDHLRKMTDPLFRLLSVTKEVRLFQDALVLQRI